MVEEDPREDRLDKETQLLEGLQSRGDPCIHFVRGMSRDTLEIVLRCRGDVIFVDKRGINGDNARIWVEAVIIVETRVIGGRIVPVGLQREPRARGLMFRTRSS